MVYQFNFLSQFMNDKNLIKKKASFLQIVVIVIIIISFFHVLHVGFQVLLINIGIGKRVFNHIKEIHLRVHVKLHRL